MPQAEGALHVLPALDLVVANEGVLILREAVRGVHLVLAIGLVTTHQAKVKLKGLTCACCLEHGFHHPCKRTI